MKKNKKTSQHRRLELQKETVIHLTYDRLKHLAGGVLDGNTSTPISKCNTQCLAAD